MRRLYCRLDVLNVLSVLAGLGLTSSTMASVQVQRHIPMNMNPAHTQSTHSPEHGLSDGATIFAFLFHKFEKSSFRRGFYAGLHRVDLQLKSTIKGCVALCNVPCEAVPGTRIVRVFIVAHARGHVVMFHSQFSCLKQHASRRPFELRIHSLSVSGSPFNARWPSSTAFDAPTKSHSASCWHRRSPCNPRNFP